MRRVRTRVWKIRVKGEEERNENLRDSKGRKEQKQKEEEPNVKEQKEEEEPKKSKEEERREKGIEEENPGDPGDIGVDKYLVVRPPNMYCLGKTRENFLCIM